MKEGYPGQWPIDEKGNVGSLCCGFSFSEHHKDVDSDLYSCPACAEIELEAKIKAGRSLAVVVRRMWHIENRKGLVPQIDNEPDLLDHAKRLADEFYPMNVLRE